MERESFENDDIAKLMNENYVCIKVDREERPDVDRIYMTFVQATQGSGGWPMSVFLTPDLKPVVGGTYFPPVDQYGRPGFPTVLKRISDMWHRNRSEVETQSRVLMDALQSGTVGTPNPQATLPASDVFHRCYESYAKKFDSIQGGFERAPKFPQPVNLNFLFRASLLPDAAQKMPKCRDMCYKTLDCMANGGIHDHVGFGFHRYSTDEEWHVPHFEKMLYDNAQLLVSYVEAFQLTKNPKYEQTARRIVEYISRDMTDPSGGIYSAEDADSLPTHASVHKKEGAFYAWTEKEIDDALSQTVPSNSGGNDVPLSDLFKARFNVKTKGNVHRSQDPHGELLNQNVLIVRESVETIAKVFKLSEDTVSQVLETSRKILFDIRAKRPRPHLDDKMLSAWNGLMLSGLAKAAQALQDETICAKSVDVGMFIRRYLYDERNNVLLHSIYRGEGQPSQIEYPIEGFCEDYACVIRGLLDLYETCFDPMYLIWAHDLQTKQDDLFWDEQDGGYFSSHSHDESLLLRLKEESDGAEPSPNSISLSNLLRLALIFDSVDWTAKAMKMFLVFSDRFERVPRAIPEMVSALMFHLQKPMQVVICGEMTDPAVAALVRVAQEVFMPFKCVVLMDKRNTEVLRPLVGNTEAFTSAGLSSQASAHICRHFSCGVPLTDPAELQRQLMSSVSSS